MKCEKCGAEISKYSRFCGSCGAIINGQCGGENQIDEREFIEKFQKKKESNKLFVLIIILVVVLTLCAIAVSLLLLFNNNSRDEAEIANNAEITETAPVQTTASAAPNEPTVSAAAETPTPVVVIITPEPIYNNDTDISESTSNNMPSYDTSESIQSYLYVVNCDEWISLRSSASKSASRITTIPLGAVVGYISNAGNGFYKVSYNGMTGYALASYLSNTNSSTARDITMYVVNCDEWISLRESPSTSSARLATIPIGASVTYISNAGDGFYKIRYNGQEGYALSQYLQ